LWRTTSKTHLVLAQNTLTALWPIQPPTRWAQVFGEQGDIMKSMAVVYVDDMVR
jgi:hypothetical protein